MKVLLNELHETQERFGYLPEDEIECIARKHAIPKAELYGIISFYSRFYLQPVEKFIVRICKSVSCGINQSEAVRQAVEKHLKIVDGRSSNGLFKLEMVECLGHCALGPVMTINDEVFAELTPKKAVEALEACQRKGG